MRSPLVGDIQKIYNPEWLEGDYWTIDGYLDVTNKQTRPMIFDSIENAIGFNFGMMIVTTDDENDFDSAYLGYDWDIYICERPGGGARKVGAINMPAKDAYQYVDVSFDICSIYSIMYQPPVPYYGRWSLHIKIPYVTVIEYPPDTQLLQ